MCQEPPSGEAGIWLAPDPLDSPGRRGSVRAIWKCGSPGGSPSRVPPPADGEWATRGRAADPAMPRGEAEGRASVQYFWRSYSARGTIAVVASGSLGPWGGAPWRATTMAVEASVAHRQRSVTRTPPEPEPEPEPSPPPARVARRSDGSGTRLSAAPG